MPTNINVQIGLPADYITTASCWVFMFVCIVFLTKKDENVPELPHDMEKTQHYSLSMSRIRLSDGLKAHKLRS